MTPNDAINPKLRIPELWQWLTYFACAAGLTSTLACLMAPGLPGWVCGGLITNAGFLFFIAVEATR